ncbi:hypothetical protein [Pseudarthrobacter enclensis]|uniref:Uncharacterized protein n=1 Tax=Pseudarthrobacter enclensis TaxID=993070 RepID=A0A0V8IMX2_9MICC|nr:hypothetical protein [Pseudarthrobacter enclensis]KSU76106.1 hypothetical protein AS031_12135 [Pseudarthrobacter enclensis]
MNTANADAREHGFAPQTDYYDSLVVRLVPSTPERDVDDTEAVFYDLPAQGWYPGEIRQHLRETANKAPIQNYVLKERSTEVNWGASGGGLEIILQVASSIADETIPVIVGAALDQLLTRTRRRRQTSGFTDQDAAVRYVKWRISLGYGEGQDQLHVLEVELDDTQAARIILAGSKGKRYECTCSQTKGGLTMTRVKVTYTE